jgi:hypothetical protein
VFWYPEIKVRPSDFPYDILEELCKITVDNKLLAADNEKYFSASDKRTAMILDSNKNRFLRVIGRIIPMGTKGRKDYLLKLYNLVLCESHRDKLFHYLESKYLQINEEK